MKTYTYRNRHCSISIIAVDKSGPVCSVLAPRRKAQKGLLVEFRLTMTLDPTCTFTGVYPCTNLALRKLMATHGLLLSTDETRELYKEIENFLYDVVNEYGLPYRHCFTGSVD